VIEAVGGPVEACERCLRAAEAYERQAEVA
jgi:hypothetical protein